MKTINKLIVLLFLILVAISCKTKHSQLSSNFTDTLSVYYYLDSVNQISLVNYNCENIPDSLIIDPGFYCFGNKSYDFTKEGLYRIIVPQNFVIQRIVYKENPLALISAFSWIITHGEKDNGISKEELNKKALNSKIYLTCGYSVKWVNSILKSKKLENRYILTLTLDNWNNYDNGHSMTETKINNKWLLFDIDNNFYFTKNDTILNLPGFYSAVQKNNYKFNYLSSDTRFEAPNQLNNNFDQVFMNEIIAVNDETLRNWYKRVVQVPMILYNGWIYFPDLFSETETERIMKYNNKQYKKVTKDEFELLFYNN